MATLYVTEFETLGGDAAGRPILAPVVPALVEQNVAIGGASALSVAFGNTTRFVMLSTDTTCCLAFGAAPVAALGAHRMAANETRFYTVAPGSKVAVIAST